MADIKIDPSYGYEVISEKMNMLVNDINGMLKAGIILEDAAKYLLENFSGISSICDEYQDLYIEETKSNLSFK